MHYLLEDAVGWMMTEGGGTSLGTARVRPSGKNKVRVELLHDMARLRIIETARVGLPRYEEAMWCDFYHDGWMYLGVMEQLSVVFLIGFPAQWIPVDGIRVGGRWRVS